MKHIVITGSTRGIGFGLAKRFLEKGCKVTINGTTEDGTRQRVEQLRQDYPQAQVQGIAGDVGNFGDMENLWGKGAAGLGRIDIWINNAGVNQDRGYAWEISSADFDRLLKINLLGVFNGSTVAMKKMAEQGGGQIYNMEGYGSDGMMRPKMTLYGTTKRAVRYFTRALAKEAAHTAVQVGTLSPGMVLTDFLLHSMDKNPAEQEKNKKIFNILADDVDTVTEFLAGKILANQVNNAHIAWLTKGKVMWRFASSAFVKRNLFK